jgi:hypothetical protein
MQRLPTAEMQKLHHNNMIECRFDDEMLNDDLSWAHGLCPDGQIAQFAKLSERECLLVEVVR